MGSRDSSQSEHDNAAQQMHAQQDVGLRPGYGSYGSTTGLVNEQETKQYPPRNGFGGQRI